MYICITVVLENSPLPNLLVVEAKNLRFARSILSNNAVTSFAINFI